VNFGWETERERVFRGAKISPAKKLEGIRLMNEMADKVLTAKQKLIRRKLREGN
jgi:hypothetical protein